tara:strand:- start:222 stop:662 length:441 start_codon:yes stop_codon:yes gene_type:complete
MTLKLIDSTFDNDPDEDKPLLPEGEYRLAYQYHFTRKIHKAMKLEVCFRVIDQGPYFMKKVSRYYNVQHKGKMGKNGKFSCGKTTAAFRELSNVLVFNRGDRIPLTLLKNVIVIAEVSTVAKDNKQQSIHPQAQYSVVRKITGKER